MRIGIGPFVGTWFAVCLAGATAHAQAPSKADLATSPSTAGPPPAPLNTIPLDVQPELGSSFDPNGPFDNGGLVKDPTAGGEPLEEEQSWTEEEGDPRGGSAPANNTCQGAVVIPGNAVTYGAPLLNTTGATVGACEGAESCEAGGAGISNSVWYTYTPNLSGTVTINTFGSNYNTVLSVWTGSCGIAGIPGCIGVPTQIVCNDDYPFGTTSQVTLSVTGGQTYKIKVSDYNTADGGGVLDLNLFWAPANDACADATIISTASYDPPVYATNNAVVDICDNPESCEVNNVGTSNSVWYSFTPDCDGSMNINTNGTNYDTVLSVWDHCGEFFAVDFPCNFPDPAPVEIACDDDSGTGTQSQLLNVPVLGGQTYLIKVSDYNTTNGGGLLDFNFLFTSGSAPVADIASPAGLTCVCDVASVQGTASTGGGATAWTLESRPAAGGSWTLINSGTSDVTDGSLGSWDTTPLSQGYHTLRLTVQNYCGASATDVETVFVDRMFDSFELREPDATDVIGGTACIDGTVWDHCFNSYTVMYRAAGTLIFSPVEPGTSNYFVPITNDPLVPNGWNTTALPDGDYDLRVSGIDNCGNAASATHAIAIDNTPPTAIITSPISCTSVDGSIEIYGTADDAHLFRWALQYTGGEEHAWVTFAQDNVPVINGLLGIWDTSTLPACGYTLRLIVTDEADLNCGTQRSQTEYTVAIDLGSTGSCCDINLDSLSNGEDVAPFVQCLLNGSCP